MIDYKYFLLQNPWWENIRLIDKDDKIIAFKTSQFQYQPKTIFNLSLDSEAVHLITGPRQTGKSTAIKLYIQRLLTKNFSPESILFFNCDAVSTVQDVIDIVLEFKKMFNGKKRAIFLDEISAVSNWPSAIKWLADSGSLKNTTLFLTGSSSIQLKKSGEFMPGRRGKGLDVIYLPISFKEYLILNKVDIKKKDLRMIVKTERYFKEFLVNGGFLRNINYGVLKSQSIYLETFKSELYKNGKKEDFVREVIRKIINSLSSQTSYTNIAEEAELGSKNTAIEYLSFLTDSFFLKEAKMYDINQKRIILKKNKKFYTTDPYFIWLLMSFISGSNNLEAMEKYYQSVVEFSKLIENFIASELFKAGFEFYYYQNSRELDFYIPKSNIAIEVKYKNKITSEDLKPLQSSYFSKTTKKIIITKDTFEKKDEISLIPAHLFSVYLDRLKR